VSASSSSLPNPRPESAPPQANAEPAQTNNTVEPLLNLPRLGSDPPIRAYNPPEILEAQATFMRDLPELLKERRGQWVAYYGTKRISFAPTKPALLEECRRQGYRHCLTRCIWPHPPFDYISAL
jgi:hypothetical protein